MQTLDKPKIDTETRTQPGTADIDAALERQAQYTRKLHGEVQQIIDKRTIPAEKPTVIKTERKLKLTPDEKAYAKFYNAIKANITPENEAQADVPLLVSLMMAYGTGYIVSCIKQSAQAAQLAEACKAVTQAISDNGRVEADGDAIDLCWQALAAYEAAR